MPLPSPSWALETPDREPVRGSRWCGAANRDRFGRVKHLRADDDHGDRAAAYDVQGQGESPWRRSPSRTADTHAGDPAVRATWRTRLGARLSERASALRSWSTTGGSCYRHRPSVTYGPDGTGWLSRPARVTAPSPSTAGRKAPMGGPSRSRSSPGAVRASPRLQDPTRSAAPRPETVCRHGRSAPPPLPQLKREGWRRHSALPPLPHRLRGRAAGRAASRWRCRTSH